MAGPALGGIVRRRVTLIFDELFVHHHPARFATTSRLLAAFEKGLGRGDNLRIESR